MPGLAGNTRDEGKLFPIFLPLVGGSVGRLVMDAPLFSIQFATDPEAPQTRLAAGDAAPSAAIPAGRPRWACQWPAWPPTLVFDATPAQKAITVE